MVDLAKMWAIDFHTHAEEPCGCHADDGYDGLQSAMAKYFGAPWSHPPTMQETAAFRDEVRPLILKDNAMRLLLGAK